MFYGVQGCGSTLLKEAQNYIINPFFGGGSYLWFPVLSPIYIYIYISVLWVYIHLILFQGLIIDITIIKLQNIESNGLESHGNGDESKLQEKIVHPYIEENKSTTTEFIEYWVPVRLSNIQTEQYCGSLFSNSTLLCSSYKFDSLKVLHEILVSTKNVSIFTEFEAPCSDSNKFYSYWL